MHIQMQAPYSSFDGYFIYLAFERQGIEFLGEALTNTTAIDMCTRIG
jgi:hypothetical protein